MANVTSTGGLAAPASTSPSTKVTSTATAKASGTTAGLPAAPTAATAKTPTFKDDLVKATEKLQPVPHHGRTKITGGERDGRYLNTSGNKRDGQTFTMEYHGGRRWHVYGEGTDRVVVPFAKPASATGGADAKATTPTPATTPAKTTTPASASAVPATSGQGTSSATSSTGGATLVTDDTTGDRATNRAAHTARSTST